jgi:hypothetical protein
MILRIWIGGALMLLRAAKILGLILSIALITSTAAHTLCSVDEVIVKGRVDHAPNHARVRVQLLYAKGVPGESGDVTVEDGRFSIPIQFLTQSRGPVINGSFGKCGRRPKTVIVTLSDQSHDYDSVSLDFATDFKMADSGTYTPRSQILLDGSR